VFIGLEEDKREMMNRLSWQRVLLSGARYGTAEQQDGD
jgi:hypothetical protein